MYKQLFLWKPGWKCALAIQFPVCHYLADYYYHGLNSVCRYIFVYIPPIEATESYVKISKMQNLVS